MCQFEKHTCVRLCTCFFSFQHLFVCAFSMSSMDRPRCRRRSSPTGLPLAAAAEAPRPPSRRSPFLKSVAFLGVSAVCCASLPSRAEAFVTSSVRGIERHLHRRAGQRAERSERGKVSVAMLSERRGLWPGRPTIDLRSDTVTQPTGSMRKAMQKVCACNESWARELAPRPGCCPNAAAHVLAVRIVLGVLLSSLHHVVVRCVMTPTVAFRFSSSLPLACVFQTDSTCLSFSIVLCSLSQAVTRKGLR